MSKPSGPGPVDPEHACNALTKSGKRCRARAFKDDLCFHHHPDAAEERAARQRASGQAIADKHNPPPPPAPLPAAPDAAEDDGPIQHAPRNLGEMKRLVSECAVQVRDGDVDAKKGQTVATLARVYMFLHMRGGADSGVSAPDKMTAEQLSQELTLLDGGKK